MEEVDNIIIQSLREIGCNIDESITSLSDFNAELVIETVVKCLNVIKPELQLTVEPMQNMAARLRFGTKLGTYIMDLKYNGTLGYQTFLYPSDVDLRRLYLFLCEKFPKEDKIEEININPKSLLEKSVANALSSSLSEPWLPHYCHRPEVKFVGHTKFPYKSVKLDVPSKLKREEDYKEYYKNYQKSVPEQVKHKENLLPSIMSYNQKLYSQPTNIIDRLDWIFLQQQQQSFQNYASSVSSIIVNDIMSPKKYDILSPKEPISKDSSVTSTKAKDNIEKNEQNIELEEERITNECENLKLNIQKEQAEFNKVKAKLSQIKLVQNSEQQELIVLEDQKNMIERLYNLLNDGDANIVKLERAIADKKSKLIHLASEWEERRKHLIQKYRNRKENNSNKAKVNEIKLLREKQQELAQELKNKEQQSIQLRNEIQKVSKDTNRSAYTQRILEIINNIKKQRDEIQKVISDTRCIKKEINNLSGRLDRSYAVAMDMCQSNKRVYDNIQLIHQKFNSVINYVEKTGATLRQIRQTEDKIDTELAKNVEANLERITADLAQMKEEGQRLKAQINNQNNANS